MARLLWLADVLRAAGLTVHEELGWRTRGSDTYGPVYGVTIHETQGSWMSTDRGEINVLLNGSTSAPPPIAQLYLSRTGQWWVVASGTCFHNKIGWDGPNEGLGNDSLLGIEAQHAKGEPWTELQYRSYVRGVAAILRHTGWPVSRVAGHKEHQPGDKSDPGFNMDRFRADVAEAMGDDDMGMTTTNADILIYRIEALFYLSPTVLSGPERGKPVPFVQALKALAEKADVDLAAIEAAAAEGAERGVAQGADELAAALAPMLGIDEDDIKAALAEVLGSARITVGAANEGGAAAVRADN